MGLPFAVVKIKVQEKRYLPGEATVAGLGGVDAPTRDAFCRAAGDVIFKDHPEIGEVRFVGPRRKETSIKRENLIP